MGKIELQGIEAGCDESLEPELVELSIEELGEVGGGQSSAAILD